MPRVAVLSSHPIPYNAALFRRLARLPDVDLTVLFASAFGTARDQRPMKNFGRRVVWDTDSLGGYPSKLLWNPISAHPQKRMTMLGLGLIGELRRTRYDAVVVFGWAYPMDWLAFLLARARGLPFLHYCDSDIRKVATFFPALIRSFFLGALFRRSTGALYTGTFNRDLYIRHGMPPQNLWFSPWAVDTEGFAAGSRERGRHAMGLRDATCYYLFVGSLIGRKRPLDLLKAVKELQERGHSAGAILVGTGEQETLLRAYARDSGVDEVHLLGFVNQSELPDVYAAADVVVLPSQKDSRGAVVNEAMAAGRPVVVSTGTGCWGPGDLVSDGREGFVFEAKDVTALVRACEELMDPETRARMGASAAERVRYWSLDRAAAGWQEALRAIA